MATVTCAECRLELNQPADLPPEKRQPCPNCGSLGRSVTVALEGVVVGVGTGHVQVLRGTAAPSVLLQSVVTLGAKTNEGRLIEAVEPAWYEIAKLIEADPAVMFQISPRKWEEMIAGWYETRGFTVTLTPSSGDHGRDVIAEMPGVLSIRIIDQVKAYSPENRVKANDVRALLGVLAGDDKANKGLVTTTSEFAPGVFTEPGIVKYMPTRLELVDGVELQKRLREVASKKS